MVGYISRNDILFRTIVSFLVGFGIFFVVLGIQALLKGGRKDKNESS